MEQTVSAAEANREFSKLLRGIREGNSYVVTSHGRPVAKLVPISKSPEEKEAAFQKLMARLQSQPVQNIGPWTREELYERDL